MGLPIPNGVARFPIITFLSFGGKHPEYHRDFSGSFDLGSLHGLDDDSPLELRFLTFFLQLQNDVKTSKERGLLGTCANFITAGFWPRGRGKPKSHTITTLKSHTISTLWLATQPNRTLPMLLAFAASVVSTLFDGVP